MSDWVTSACVRREQEEWVMWGRPLDDVVFIDLDFIHQDCLQGCNQFKQLFTLILRTYAPKCLASHFKETLMPTEMFDQLRKTSSKKKKRMKNRLMLIMPLSTVNKLNNRGLNYSVGGANGIFIIQNPDRFVYYCILLHICYILKSSTDTFAEMSCRMCLFTYA